MRNKRVGKSKLCMFKIQKFPCFLGKNHFMVMLSRIILEAVGRDIKFKSRDFRVLGTRTSLLGYAGSTDYRSKEEGI